MNRIHTPFRRTPRRPSLIAALASVLVSTSLIASVVLGMTGIAEAQAPAADAWLATASLAQA